MTNPDELIDLLWRVHIKPAQEYEVTEKYMAAIKHEMTCTDPTHNHGIAEVSWAAPEEEK